ncbi:MAG: type II toxin-antitoxin system prevent-host-death family antitoxin [Actinomycetota bacterium]
MSEARTHLSALLRRVAAGDEVEVLRRGRPVAPIVPVPRGGARTLGVDRGRLVVPDDFDRPFPDDVLDRLDPRPEGARRHGSRDSG